MLKDMRLLGKISLGLGLFVLGAVLLTLINLSSLNAVIMQAEQRELEAYAQDIQHSLNAQMRTGEMLAASIAQQPTIQAAFAKGERETLREMLTPVFKHLQQNFGIEQFQFHTPPAISFLRLHMLERFGDDLSSFRATVVQANQQKNPVTGIEVGVAGLGIRSVVPVFYQNEHQGSVEFGLSLGQVFFDEFVAQRGIDATLHLIKQDEIQTFAFTLTEQPMLDKHELLSVYEGTALFKYSEFAGQERAVYAIPVYDFSQQPIAVIELIRERSYYIEAFHQVRNSAIIVTMSLLGLGILLSLIMAKDLRGRINQLISNMQDIANGNLDTQITEKNQSRDEIGELAASVITMRIQLHTLVAKVMQNTQALNHSSQEITLSIKDQAATSTQTSSSIAEITSTMEQLSASSNQVAEYAKSLAHISDTTYKNTQEGMNAMHAIAASMQNIEKEGQNNLDNILDLSEKSKEIGKIMNIINTIADQSKLIAFNAALEAADDTHSGRRFSVVASEIRRLADNVSESTREIEQKIEQIQDSTARLMTTAEHSVETIASGIHAMHTTAQHLADLVQAAREGSSAAEQIALSSQQQKTASNQVTVALREIVSASRYTSQSIDRIAKTSQDMSVLANELNALVQHFTLNCNTDPSYNNTQKLNSD